jgi:dihydrolipoamide dehydrogenase
MNSSSNHFDLIVIGSGAAGGATAQIAHKGGYSVAIIEKDKVGGDCPNYACVPTKALLRSAKVYSLLKRAGEFGLHAGSVDFDWADVIARKERIIGQTGAASAEERYQKEGIVLFKGMASLADEYRVRVEGEILRGDHIMIATGTKPTLPKIEGLDQIKPITNIEAVSLQEFPTSVIILGGGPVGCEFAQLFSTFGARVMVLEMEKTILSHEEPELSQIVQQALEKNGVSVLTGVEVERLAKDGQQKKAQAKVQGQRREFSAEEILVATGREAQSAALNLEAAGVETEKDSVKINEYLQTTQRHIYAGGDVSGPLLYTHFAHYQGSLAGRNMFSDEPRQADYRVVPRVTFTDPEIASVGLTEEQARQEGRKVISGKSEIGALGKALVESEDQGLIKIVADARSGEILGGHIVAPAAGEMVHEIVAAMAGHATVSDLAAAIHAYPTFAEGIKVAAAVTRS